MYIYMNDTPTPKILATGGWSSRKDCPSNPNPLKTNHSFTDVSSKPSPTLKGRKAGERLVTSQCKFCGGLIVDCPTISI